MATFIDIIACAGLCLLLLPSIMCLKPRHKISDSWVLKDFERGLEAEAAELEPALRQINDLVAKQLIRTNNEADIRLIRRLLAEPSSTGSRLNCFSRSKCKSDDKKRAMEMIVSLNSLAKQCNMGSLRVFATLMRALEYSPDIKFVERIDLITYGKLNELSLYCEDVFLREYDLLLWTSLKDDKTQLERLTTILRGISLSDFDKFHCQEKNCKFTDCERECLIAMPDFKIKRDAANALEKIVREIRKQLEESDDSKREAFDEELKRTFDQYLFEPCKLLRGQRLAAVLRPALILAAYHRSSFYGYLEEHPKFFEAIFNYGFCGKLLDQRDQLHPELLEVWRRVAREEFKETDN